ncbi:hypothetical protein HDU76_000341 [Blyttiomyces sp. JEL0837]|nr:hypothetical protein HDU76_000341 [Blyttiomyces sp. JEL0837]
MKHQLSQLSKNPKQLSQFLKLLHQRVDVAGFAHKTNENGVSAGDVIKSAIAGIDVLGAVPAVLTGVVDVHSVFATAKGKQSIKAGDDAWVPANVGNVALDIGDAETTADQIARPSEQQQIQTQTQQPQQQPQQSQRTKREIILQHLAGLIHKPAKVRVFFKDLSRNAEAAGIQVFNKCVDHVRKTTDVLAGVGSSSLVAAESSGILPSMTVGASGNALLSADGPTETIVDEVDNGVGVDGISNGVGVDGISNSVGVDGISNGVGVDGTSSGVGAGVDGTGNSVSIGVGDGMRAMELVGSPSQLNITGNVMGNEESGGGVKGKRAEISSPTLNFAINQQQQQQQSHQQQQDLIQRQVSQLSQTPNQLSHSLNRLLRNLDDAGGSNKTIENGVSTRELIGKTAGKTVPAIAGGSVGVGTGVDGGMVPTGIEGAVAVGIGGKGAGVKRKFV